jgi:hypothetical protein
MTFEWGVHEQVGLKAVVNFVHSRPSYTLLGPFRIRHQLRHPPAASPLDIGGREVSLNRIYHVMSDARRIRATVHLHLVSATPASLTIVIPSNCHPSRSHSLFCGVLPVSAPWYYIQALKPPGGGLRLLLNVFV